MPEHTSHPERPEPSSNEQKSSSHRGTLDALARVVAWSLPAVVLLAAFLKLDTPHIGGDGLAYYAWLHSLVQDGDLSLENEFQALEGKLPELYQLFEVPETGRVGTAFPFGGAFLWAPAYKALLGLEQTQWYARSIAARIDEAAYLQEQGVGFMPGLAMTLGTNLMVMASVYLTLDIVRRWVPLLLASLSVLAVFVGTPLLYYSTIEPAMAHAPATLVVTAMYWLFFRVGIYSMPEQRERPWVWLLTGLVLGLATMVRWQLALLGIPFVLLLLYQRRWKSLGAFCLGALMLVWMVPAVWYRMFGKVFVLPASHTDPRAFVPGLRSPLRIWFSGQVGLATWSPVVVLSVLGVLISIRKHPQIAFVFLVSFLLESLMSASVVDWWAGWSFGTRRMTELYPLYALGLGLFAGVPLSSEWFQRRAWAHRAALTVVALAATALATLWSLALLFTYANGFIHPEWGTTGDAGRFLGSCTSRGYLSHRDQFADRLQSSAPSGSRWAQTPPGLQPDEMEPKGLSVVELTGLVPDDVLKGAIVSSSASTGIVVYESGARVANTTVVTTTIYPRLSTPTWAPDEMLTVFGCLGQASLSGNLGTSVRPSRLRVYDSDGKEVTSEIEFMFVTQAENLPPSPDGATPAPDYRERDYGSCRTVPIPLSKKGLEIPANSGCRIWIPGSDYYPLTGVFEVADPASIQVEVTGSQRAIFQSSIKEAGSGAFRGFEDQMLDRYGTRQDALPLSAPDGSNYFLTRYPPMPGDALAGSMADLPGLNVDRLSAPGYVASAGKESVGLAASGVYPLAFLWQAAPEGQPSVRSPQADPPEVVFPEYVLAAGVPFRPCYTQGTCTQGILGEVFEAEMPVQFTYLGITHLPVE